MGGPEPEAEPRLVEGEAQIRDFIAQVEAGHASMTMQLTSACCQQEEGHTSNALHAAAAAGGTDGDECRLSLQLGTLRAQLSSGSGPAARNRTLRQWLVAHREQVVEHWHELGFPPVGPQTEAVSSDGTATGEPGGIVGPQGPAGIVVFDFDATLSTCQVGWQHIQDACNACNRAFGGVARVEMLRHMLKALRHS